MIYYEFFSQNYIQMDLLLFSIDTLNFGYKIFTSTYANTSKTELSKIKNWKFVIIHISDPDKSYRFWNVIKNTTPNRSESPEKWKIKQRKIEKTWFFNISKNMFFLNNFCYKSLNILRQVILDVFFHAESESETLASKFVLDREIIAKNST